jgi:hypothetical protein
VNTNGPVVFDVTGWRGVTIIKGSEEFFNQLSNVLNLDVLIATSHELLLNDMKECVQSEDAYFYNDTDNFSVFRFHQLNQITMTKRYAFDLGESIFSCLKKATKDSHYVNTLFAFAKKLQTAAVGFQKNKD